MNKNIIISVVVIVGVFLAFTAYVAWENEKDSTPKEMATEFIGMMDDGDFSKCVDIMNDEMKSVMSAQTLSDIWVALESVLGDLKKIEDVVVSKNTDITGTKSLCVFEYGGLSIEISFDSDGKVIGLFFGNYSPRDSDPLPGSLEETDITLNVGTQLELKGKITSHANSDNKVAVVIVHGSGASDMDLSTGMNKMYRDLAWGIAENGIDVLRYDKRTFTHILSVIDPTFTVKEETVDDAIAAAKLLKSEGYEKVFLVGHSLGGMLAPRIVSESNGAFDGFVSMAGSPRTLVEVMIDQNMSVVTSIADLELINAEKAKYTDMRNWDNMKLMTTSIFGTTAYYIKEMESKSAGNIARSLNVPMLFIQGSKDFQVFADKDFEAWKNVMSGRSNAEFILYPGLNHMFAESKGYGLLEFYKEYYPRNDTSVDVIEDISEFIKKNT
jgi:Lysophospholipase